MISIYKYKKCSVLFNAIPTWKRQKMPYTVKVRTILYLISEWLKTELF